MGVTVSGRQGGDSGAPSSAKYGVREPGTDRKLQIVQATLRLIAEHGLVGASMSRIAKTVGVSNAALYRHFESREDILIAAYRSLTDRIFSWLESCTATNVVDRLRELGEQHAPTTSMDTECFTAPMFQFITWIPRDGLREEVKRRRFELRQWFTDLIDRGKAQGSIRADVETDLAVGQLIAWIWWEDLSYLEGFDMDVTRKVSAEMFKRFVDGIRVPDSEVTPGSAGEELPALRPV